MGISASAHLVFGIKIDPEWYTDYLKTKAETLNFDEEPVEGIEWERIYAALKADLKQPIGPYEKIKEAYREYLKNRRRLIEECEIEISPIGHYEDPLWETEIFIVAKGIIATDCESTEIRRLDLDIDISKWDNLKDFCQIMDIPYTPPQWYLIASLE
jgi:hypothetical protein